MKQNNVKLGIHPKFDLWFIILLTVVLWSIASQFIGIILVLIGAGLNEPSTLVNMGLWMRLLVTGLGVYGTVWVIRIYIRSVKDRTLREYKQREVIRKYLDAELVEEDDEKLDMVTDGIIKLLREE